MAPLDATFAVGSAAVFSEHSGDGEKANISERHPKQGGDNPKHCRASVAAGRSPSAIHVLDPQFVTRRG